MFEGNEVFELNHNRWKKECADLHERVVDLEIHNERLRANAKKVMCVYCGEIMGKRDEGKTIVEMISLHGPICDKRPEARMMKDIVELERKLAESEKERNTLLKIVKLEKPPKKK